MVLPVFPLIFRAASMEPIGLCFVTWETAMDQMHTAPLDYMTDGTLEC